MLLEGKILIDVEVLGQTQVGDLDGEIGSNEDVASRKVLVAELHLVVEVIHALCHLEADAQLVFIRWHEVAYCFHITESACLQQLLQYSLMRSNKRETN